MFSRADIFVRTNENQTFEKVEEFLPEADRIFENARTITIKLNKIAASAIQVELYFSSSWILISEVTFDSGKCVWMSHFILFSYQISS